jgi:prepilin-type N-terminal cleavage/methylation domain-containing protein
MTRLRSAGFTLVEVLIAMVLLSTCALGLARGLVGAQRAQETSDRWMTAVLLAGEGIEQLRAGQTVAAAPPASGFQRSGTVAPGAPVGLDRLEVTVTWVDPAPRRFQIVTLARR